MCIPFVILQEKLLFYIFQMVKLLLDFTIKLKFPLLYPLNSFMVKVDSYIVHSYMDTGHMTILCLLSQLIRPE